MRSLNRTGSAFRRSIRASTGLCHTGGITDEIPYSDGECNRRRYRADTASAGVRASGVGDGNPWDEPAGRQSLVAWGTGICLRSTDGGVPEAIAIMPELRQTPSGQRERIDFGEYHIRKGPVTKPSLASLQLPAIANHIFSSATKLIDWTNQPRTVVSGT